MPGPPMSDTIRRKPAEMHTETAPRPLLCRCPAGPFFAMSAVFAVLLSWVWTLPVADARLVHLRLGIFGFGGAAVVGYVLTALPAWTQHRPPLGLRSLVLAFLLGRGLALAFPAAGLPPALPGGVIGLAILYPALRGAPLSRLPIAAAPLTLALGELGIVHAVIPAEVAEIFMACLILLVGGRAVPAFIATEAARRGQTLPAPGSLLLPFALVLFTAGLGRAVALGAGILLAGSILWRIRHAWRAGAANLMLAGAWGTLALTMPGLLLAGSGIGIEMGHLFLIVTMGGTVFAFAGRAAMERPASGGLRPRRVQLPGMALVIAAGPMRFLAGSGHAESWLAISAACWSLGWLCFLGAFLPALWRPAPFPVLSAAREMRGPADEP